MTPHDQKRFGAMVREFIAGAGLAGPLYLVAISDSNGSVIVSHHSGRDVKQICSRVVGRGLASPILLTLIEEESGRCASARIEPARVTVQ
jgi:hypothetical protein